MPITPDQAKKFLKLRKPIACACRKRISREKERAKYGTCACDTYSMNYTLAIVLSNYLYQYLANASQAIKEEDSYWQELEAHAGAIRAFAEADSWDLMSKEKGVKAAYLKKERAFKKALAWLGNNWHGLWW